MFNFYLIQARKESCLTQEDLAELISYDRAQVSRWEHGKTPVKPEQVVLLGRILGE